jgi:AraC-like DNA-binding protein
VRKRLVAVMESSRPHVDASLRLPDLAGLVEVPPYQLSQVLNQGFGLRFNDFVNRYRVEEAIRLLSDPARNDESLLSLAFEAGFNNKTSFNQAFKKYTRTTPSRYRAELSRQPL